MATAITPSAIDILEGMTPPLADSPRRHYRQFVRTRFQLMSLDDLRCLLIHFACSLEDLETRVMDWQYDRARRLAQERREVERRQRRQEAAR